MLFDKSKIDKPLLFIIISSLLLGVIIVTQNIHVYAMTDMKVMNYDRFHVQVEEIEYSLTKKEAKQLVKDLYNTPHIYIETSNINEYSYANSFIMARVVRIKPNLSILDYVFSYAHELTHIKYQTADETYTMFKTFTTLYESGNEELQNIALRYAQNIIEGGYLDTEYDCGYYILEYFKGEI